MKLPRPVRAVLRFFTFVVAGAVLGAVGRGMYGMYKLQVAEQSIAKVPVDALLFQVFEVHLYAAYGAIVVSVWWICERMFWAAFRGTRDFASNFFGRRVETTDFVDTDTKIKMMRSAKADAYLESTIEKRKLANDGELEPSFDNRITAKGGTLTYIVTAVHYLTDEEMRKIVWDALQDGTISEPTPGGTTHLTLTPEMEQRYLGRNLNPSR